MRAARRIQTGCFGAAFLLASACGSGDMASHVSGSTGMESDPSGEGATAEVVVPTTAPEVANLVTVQAALTLLQADMAEAMATEVAMVNGMDMTMMDTLCAGSGGMMGTGMMGDEMMGNGMGMAMEMSFADCTLSVEMNAADGVCAFDITLDGAFNVDMGSDHHRDGTMSATNHAMTMDWQTPSPVTLAINGNTHTFAFDVTSVISYDARELAVTGTLALDGVTYDAAFSLDTTGYTMAELGCSM